MEAAGAPLGDVALILDEGGRASASRGNLFKFDTPVPNSQDAVAIQHDFAFCHDVDCVAVGVLKEGSPGRAVGHSAEADPPQSNPKTLFAQRPPLEATMSSSGLCRVSCAADALNP